MVPYIYWILTPYQIHGLQIFSPTPLGRLSVTSQKVDKDWQGCGEKGTVVHCWWKYELGQPLQTAVWRFLKKIKYSTTIQSSNLTLGIYSKEMN